MNSELSHPKYRPDIDGLRALAVLAVVFYHAFPNEMSGGFIGVDVFFVISGFLISTIIFESLKKGSFSFPEFYARRIRRIFPALLLVLISCYFSGWFLLLPEEYAQLGKHIASGAAFLSNFTLLNEAGYFDGSADSKPLLHLWSLGIEEQFYIIWPILAWMAWRLKKSFSGICIIFLALSFFLNLQGISKNPVAIFYSPHSRFWELLSGSALACLALGQNNSNSAHLYYGLNAFLHNNAKGNNSNTLSSLISVLGFFLLIFGFSTIDRHVNFPGAWALIPVVATTLIISAGPNAFINRHFLSTKLLVRIGLISFPLYLWHWPLLSFASILSGEVLSTWTRVSLVLFSIVLAWLTFEFIEKPFRLPKNTKIKVITLSFLMIAVGCVGFYSFEKNGLEGRYNSEKLSQQTDLKFKYERSNDWICDPSIFSGTYCSYSGTYPFTVVIGDSHSPRIYYGLRDLYRSAGKGIANIGSDGCPPLIDTIGVDSRLSYDPNCIKHMSETIKRVAKDKSIETIILSSRGPLYTEGTGFGAHEKFSWKLKNQDKSSEQKSNSEAYAAGLKATLNLLTESGKKVIFLYDVPELGFYAKSCLNTAALSFISGFRNPCAIKYEDYLKRNESFKILAKSVLDKFSNVKTIDLSEALCDQIYCFASINGVLMYTDDDHPSARGAIFIAKKLEKHFIDEE